MKKNLLFILVSLCICIVPKAQQKPSPRQNLELTALIDKYSQAREQRDTALLREIMLPEVDQLVSTGEWREGINSAIRGMINSSATTPGTRTLKVDRIRLLGAEAAIIDCKYLIQDTTGSPRNMWSTFIAVANKNVWRIAAIRNMLPAKQ
jgi:uncharacterized protein (TIGR02246 family)